MAVGLCVVFLPCATLAQDALRSDDPLVQARETRARLARIHNAAQTRNYQGTVVVSAGGASTSSRLAHGVAGRQHIERIDAMDGVARSVVRQNEQVHTVWPQRRVVTVEQRDQISSFPSLLHGEAPAITAHYELQPQGQERVAGHEAQVLRLRARDGHRYGYRLWTDHATALLLRLDVLGERGEVLESSAFSDVSIGPRPTALLQPLRKLEGFKVHSLEAQRTQLREAGWQLSPPVAGFIELSCLRRMAETLMLQAVFSDGLAYVTVFIEPYDADRHPHAMRTVIGATQTVMRRQGTWWITLMGDVPAATLRAFSEALVRSE